MRFWFVLSLLVGSVGMAAEVAITIDDFALHDGPLMTARQKDEAILDTLEKNKVDVALFVMAGTLENPVAKERLDAKIFSCVDMTLSVNGSTV